MLETIKTKLCPKCQTEKSVELFSKDKTTKDGLQTRCKECAKAYQQTNAEANKEKIAKQGKSYREANKEKIAKRKKAYREANKDKRAEYIKTHADRIAAQMKEYRQSNASKIVEYRKKYNQNNASKLVEYRKAYFQTPIGKAAKKNSNHKRRSITKQGDVTTQQLLELQQNAKACYWCGISLKGKKVHVDHYVPLKLGGEHALNNLVVSCSHCNQNKHAKDPIKFANSIGKLF